MKEIDFKSLVFSKEAQFHVLKHFNSIDKEFLDELIIAGFSKSDINSHLKISSSKFNPSFCSNPIQLLSIIKRANKRSEIQASSGKKNIELSFEFSKNDYPNGIGWDHLISIKDLTEKQLINIEKRKVQNAVINFTEGKPIPTHELNFVLEQKDSKHHIVTIHPGIYAPPFPDITSQNNELFQISKVFWDEHVFVFIS